MKSLPPLCFGAYPGWFCLQLAILLGMSLSGFGAAAKTPEQPVPPAPVFTVSPIDPSEISGIVPLGNLNPQGGHVFPTDHIYLDYGGKARLTVRAPTEGTVYAIRDQLHGGAKIEVRVDAHLSQLVETSTLQRPAPANANSAPVRGVLLVQLVDEHKLRVEWFAGKAAAAVSRFSEAASLYLR